MKNLSYKFAIVVFVFQTISCLAATSVAVTASKASETIYKCDLDERSKKFLSAQSHAEQAVLSLDEYKKLQEEISKGDRILLDSRLRSGNGQKIKHCLWEVSVYTDFVADNRRMLWHVFLVDRNKVRFQMVSL